LSRLNIGTNKYLKILKKLDLYKSIFLV